MWGMYLEAAEHDLLLARDTPTHNLGEQYLQHDAAKLFALFGLLDKLSPESQAAYPGALKDFFAAAPGWLVLRLPPELEQQMQQALPIDVWEVVFRHLAHPHHRRHLRSLSAS